MNIGDLFTIAPGHALALNQMEEVEEELGIAFVSRTAQNNGVVAWVKEIPGLSPWPAGALTVCLRSRNHALATFVQVNQFYTAFHVAVLEPKRPMTLKEKLWWALCIEHNRYRYNFGRQANRSLARIALPDVVPNWISSATFPEIASTPLDAAAVALPKLSSWARFRIADLFAVHRGRSIVRREAEKGSTPLVTASARNNGVSALVALPPDHPGGRITVCSNGSVGEAFVQPDPFVATADVTILEPLTAMGDGAKHFVCTMLRREKYRFNYGRKWPAGKLAGSEIRLPCSSAGCPDLALMERYMRSLPLSAVALAA